MNLRPSVLTLMFFAALVPVQGQESWSEPADLGGVNLGSGPSAVAGGQHRVDVLYRGPNEHLWINWLDEAQRWSAPTDLGGVALNSEPVVVTGGSHRVDVFYRGPNNHLWTSWWPDKPGSEWWSAPTDLGGEALSSAPSAVTGGQHGMDVFYRGPNNHLWTSWWPDKPGSEWWSAPTDLSGEALSSAPAAVTGGQHGMDVFYRGPNNHLWISWWPDDSTSVVTQHNDNYRSGVYSKETTLTPAQLLSRGMQQKYTAYVEGSINAQLLYVRNALAKGNINGLFVATMQNKIYAFDADTGSEIWKSIDLKDSDQVARPFARGISSTTVIDLATHRIYVLFSTKNQVNDEADCPDSSMPVPPPGYAVCNGFEDQLSKTLDVAYWLVAIDYRDGSELARVQVSANDASGNPFLHRISGSPLNFVARNQEDRAALLIDRGSIYLSFAMRWNENIIEYHGWVIRYRASDLTPQGAFCTSKDMTVLPPYKLPHPGSLGASVWQGGGGLAADFDGNVYFLTGNGRADVPHGWYGDSFVKLTPSGNTLIPTAFTPFDPMSTIKNCPYDPTKDCSNDPKTLEDKDVDLGAGGPMVLPETTLVIGGGKTGYMYLLDKHNMTLRQQFAASTNLYSPAGQDLRWQDWDAGPHLHGSPTYWRGPDPKYGYLYVWGEKDFLRQYRFDTTSGQIELTPLHVGTFKALEKTMPGGMISISANGNVAGSGIVWTTLPASDVKPTSCLTWFGRLYAFNAETLSPLWDAPIPCLGKWLEPTIADGKVFVGTSSISLDGTAKVIAYELRPIPTHSPQPPFEQKQPYQPVCTKCGVKIVPPLHEIYPDEASIERLRAMALRRLAPETPTMVSFELHGEGQLVYESARDRNNGDRLSWQRKSSEAELREVSLDQPFSGQPVLVQLSSGQTWIARDGSKITAEPQKEVSAPGRSANSWILFRVSRRSGTGLLSKVEYVQEFLMDGGEPPKEPPSGPGLVRRVPYTADYIFYHAR